MRKIKKDLEDIPLILTNDSRKDAFQKNIDDHAYLHGKGLYKTDSVQKKLNAIYFNKCVYCEKDISDEDKHIEHYRPKSRYYWLAYSWDNLLLSCARCNKSKGDDFETNVCSVLYGNENFSDIHTLGEYYDKEEQPKTINPEREDVLSDIVFNRDAEISSPNLRVTHTIDNVCKLNRNELIQKRIKIVNGFIKRVNRHFKNYKDKKDYKDFSMFNSDIEYLLDECSIENEFYTFRYFIVNNIEIFFEDKILQTILNNMIKEQYA